MDEVDERAVGPVQVFEDQDDRAVLAHPFEVEAPGGEKVVSLEARPLLEAEQVRDPRLHEAPFFFVQDMLHQDGAKLLQRRAGSSSSAILHRMRTMSASAQ